MCVSRLEEGQLPACAATCPTRAILFGGRDEMLGLAHERIKNEPNRYIDHVYGEHENGGTSTFYISTVPFEQLGFPTTEQTESPAHFNRLVTHGTPAVAASVAIGMTGIYLAIQRQVKDNAAAQHADEQGENSHAS
jgi:formate dehydrogenase iron-sulfur subunit